MKNAALFAIGLSSVSFGLLDGARCQTSRAPPLSLARPAPLPDDTAPPPAIIRASPAATDEAPPPKATAKRSAPVTPREAARDAPPPKPAADYDGFTTGAHDEPVAKLPDMPRATNRSKPKKESKKESNSVAAQPSDDSGEDERLKRLLTICRDCK